MLLEGYAKIEAKEPNLAAQPQKPVLKKPGQPGRFRIRKRPSSKKTQVSYGRKEVTEQKWVFLFSIFFLNWHESMKILQHNYYSFIIFLLTSKFRRKRVVCTYYFFYETIPSCLKEKISDCFSIKTQIQKAERPTDSANGRLWQRHSDPVQRRAARLQTTKGCGRWEQKTGGKPEQRPRQTECRQPRTGRRWGWGANHL